MTLYTTLDVPTDADAQRIRQAYRSLSQKHHPDKGGYADTFKNIQQAYDILSDPEKRRRYDETGDTGGPPTPRMRAVASLPQLMSQIMDTHDVVTTDILAAAAKSVRELQAQHEREAAALRKKAGLRGAALERLSVKEGRPGFLAQAVTADIAQLEAQASQNEGVALVCDEMLLILDDHEYQWEVKPANPWRTEGASFSDLVGMMGQTTFRQGSTSS